MKFQVSHTVRLYSSILLLISFSCKQGSNSEVELNNENGISENTPISAQLDTAYTHAGNGESSESLITSETQQLEFDGDFTLPLDSETPIFNSFSQPAMINDSLKLIWFNLENYSLDVFDLASQQLEKKIYYEKSGPNALGGINYGSGINFVNVDTIVFYSRDLKRIYLSNLAGKVYKKVDLSDFIDGLGSVSLSSPIAYRKGSLFLQVLPNIPIEADVTYSVNYNKVAKVDLKSGKIKEYEIPYPSIYSEKNVSQQLKMIDLVYNSKIDKFVISFPLGGSIYVTDFETGVKSHPAKSDFDSRLTGIDVRPSTIEPSRVANYNYWVNSSYERLLYDSFNGIYLREARKGISEDDFQERKFSSKREFVILNEDFQKIGSIDYVSSSLYYYFFADGKVYWNKDLQKFNLENGVEDSIFFHSRKLVVEN